MRYFHLPGPKNMGTKWYSVHLQPDLFGGTHLISRWGRVGRSKVSENVERFTSVAEATNQLEVLVLSQLEVGYTELERSELERHITPAVGQQLQLLIA